MDLARWAVGATVTAAVIGAAWVFVVWKTLDDMVSLP